MVQLGPRAAKIALPAESATCRQSLSRTCVDVCRQFADSQSCWLLHQIPKGLASRFRPRPMKSSLLFGTDALGASPAVGRKSDKGRIMHRGYLLDFEELADTLQRLAHSRRDAASFTSLAKSVPPCTTRHLLGLAHALPVLRCRKPRSGRCCCTPANWERQSFDLCILFRGPPSS